MVVVGWTGEPASTTKLLEQINQSRLKNNRAYRNFLYGSKICVNKMIKAFREADIKGIQKQVQINRQLLIDSGKDLGVEIESLLLTKLCHIGQKYKGYGKTLGAGGGDCGILILDSDEFLPQIIEEWREAGIMYLPLI